MSRRVQTIAIACAAAMLVGVLQHFVAGAPYWAAILSGLVVFNLGWTYDCHTQSMHRLHALREALMRNPES